MATARIRKRLIEFLFFCEQVSPSLRGITSVVVASGCLWESHDPLNNESRRLTATLLKSQLICLNLLYFASSSQVDQIFRNALDVSALIDASDDGFRGG